MEKNIDKTTYIGRVCFQHFDHSISEYDFGYFKREQDAQTAVDIMYEAGAVFNEKIKVKVLYCDIMKDAVVEKNGLVICRNLEDFLQSNPLMCLIRHHMPYIIEKHTTNQQKDANTSYDAEIEQ